jgi:DUF4097 and DUF4098 domain-containing protein YvlB
MYRLLIWMLLISASTGNALAQRHTETIKRTLSFSDESTTYVVFAENINGSIEVSHSGTEEVLLEAELEITGRSQKIVDQGKQEVKLISKILKDTILIYIECPAISYYRHDSRRGFNYNSIKIDYDFKADIKLKIPAKAIADVSTINEGDVTIKDHPGLVKASNVNGNISIEQVNQVLHAVTVNGEINIACKEQPSADAEFKTINGDIRIQYPAELDAKLRFKSFNGEFFTD